METRAKKRGGGRIAGAGAGGDGASEVEELGGHPPSNAGLAWQILPATPPPRILYPPCHALNGIL